MSLYNLIGLVVSILSLIFLIYVSIMKTYKYNYGIVDFVLCVIGSLIMSAVIMFFHFVVIIIVIIVIIKCYTDIDFRNYIADKFEIPIKRKDEEE